MTGEEKNVHERAVKLRKMTDDKLVEHIDHIREEAYNTGYSKPRPSAHRPRPRARPCRSSSNSSTPESARGIKSATAYKIAEFAREQGLPRMSGPVKDPPALQGARSRAQGGRLEEQIEALMRSFDRDGRADISKTPEPMKPVSQPNKSGQFRAVYTKKAEPDFKGVMLGGRAVMFEAKSTGTAG